MMHIPAAAGPGPVAMRIRKRRRTEHFTPALAPPQPISIVQGVARFVAQNTHQPARIAAFSLTHDAPFQTLEARMRQIERHGNARNAVWGKPFFGEPGMGLETDAAACKL